MYGKLEMIDGRFVVRFERRLGHAPQKVWRALTEAGELAHWFPAEIEGLADARAPGAALRFVFAGEESVPGGTGVITEFDPPRLLAFTWDDEEGQSELLRFDLSPGPGPDQCVLIFTHTFDDRAKGSRDMSGWHLCLDALVARLAGEPAPEATPEQWQTVYSHYVREFGIHDWPAFLKSPANRVQTGALCPEGAEAYAFDGADGNQVVLRLALRDLEIPENPQDFDEYVIVLEGSYDFRLNEHNLHLEAGQEFHIPRGGRVSARATAGSRTIHVYSASVVARRT